MNDDFITGPVMAQAEIAIAASEREVWAVLADIDGWPTWNPAVREATLDDDLEVGRRFRYATTVGAFRCRLREVDGPHRLAWSGRMLTMTSRQRWSIQAAPEGCRVSTESSLAGIGARLFRSRNAVRLQADLAAIVSLLKLETEARLAESSRSTQVGVADDE